MRRLLGAAGTLSLAAVIAGTSLTAASASTMSRRIEHFQFVGVSATSGRASAIAWGRSPRAGLLTSIPGSSVFRGGRSGPFITGPAAPASSTAGPACWCPSSTERSGWLTGPVDTGISAAGEPTPAGSGQYSRATRRGGARSPSRRGPSRTSSTPGGRSAACPATRAPSTRGWRRIGQPATPAEASQRHTAASGWPARVNGVIRPPVNGAIRLGPGPGGRWPTCRRPAPARPGPGPVTRGWTARPPGRRRAA
jgi:hypothetical protein